MIVPCCSPRARIKRVAQVRGLGPASPVRHGPASATAVTFKGTVGRKVRSRAYTVDVGAGPFTAVLRFVGGKRMTLSTTFGRVSGRSPLQLQGVATPGTYALRVAGTGVKTSFALAVTYVK